MKYKKKTKEKNKAPAPSIKEQEKVASSLLSKMDNADPGHIISFLPDADTAAVFINLLPLKDESSLPVLTALEETFKEKQVKKAIKRALFKLQSRGISTEGFFKEENATPILRALPKEKPKCLIGAVDGFGHRSFALMLPQKMQAIDAALGIVSDESGIGFMTMGPASKKTAGRLLEEFAQESGPMVETSLPHLATILEKAHEKNRELETQLSESYIELRPWLLENCSLLDHAVIFDHIPESSIQDQSLTSRDVDRLLQQEFMFSWIIDYEKLKPFMEELAAIHESPIILTEMQKAGRIMEIKEKCGRTVFPPEKSGLLKQRLEEMAYFFLKLNDEENARTSLLSSMNLNDRDGLFSKSLFIERLVEMSMVIFNSVDKEGFAEENPERTTGSGPIWNP